MKKPKINLSGESIKNFFAYHVEKLILVVVLALVGLFVMWGYQMESYTAYTPDRMESESQAAARSMTRDDVWTDLRDEKERDITETQSTMAQGLGENNDGRLPPIGGVVYSAPQPLNPPRFAPNSKRGDPEVFPAIEVVAHAGYGALAMPNTNPQAAAPNAIDPLAGLDPLLRAAKQYELKLKEEAEAEALKNAARTGGRDERGGLLEGGYTTERMGRGSSSGAGLTNQIPLTAEQQEALAGFQTQGMGAVGAAVMPRAVNYVAVTALAPYKKQRDEYEAVLKDSAGYEVARDTPQYVWFVVERADVADDGTTGEWKAISNTGNAVAMEQFYSGTAPDLVDPRYKDPALTMTVPPIMLRDLTEVAVHPKTPMISLEDETAAEAATPDITEFSAQDAAPGTLLQPGAFNQSAGRGRGEGGIRQPAYGTRGREGSGIGRGMRGREGEGSMLLEEQIMDYKLVRFFDFTVQPGKKYQYRVQLWVTDPNRPQDPASQPPPFLLQQEVQERNKVLDRAQAQNPAAPRVFWRTTEWSEPSPVVGLPRTWEVLAGEMKKTKTVDIRVSSEVDASFEMPGEEPTIRTMAITWNPKFAADVPGEAEVSRGSVLNFTTNVNVLHPPTTSVVTLPDYAFDTGAIVLDMRGGETLPGGDRKDPLMVPAEMLFIDSEGNMVVRNELDDKREFRLNHYEMPPEPPMPTREDPSMEMERGRDPLFGGESGRQPRRQRGG